MLLHFFFYKLCYDCFMCWLSVIVINSSFCFSQYVTVYSTIRTKCVWLLNINKEREELPKLVGNWDTKTKGGWRKLKTSSTSPRRRRNDQGINNFDFNLCGRHQLGKPPLQARQSLVQVVTGAVLSFSFFLLTCIWSSIYIL